MAFLIPSKYIYDVKHNKLLDNKIETVRYSSRKENFKESVFEKSFDFWATEETTIGDIPSSVLGAVYPNEITEIYHLNATRYYLKNPDLYKKYLADTTETLYERFLVDIDFTIPNYIKPNSIRVKYEYNYLPIKSFDGMGAIRNFEVSGNPLNEFFVESIETDFESVYVAKDEIYRFDRPSGFVDNKIEAKPAQDDNVYNVVIERGFDIEDYDEETSDLPTKDVKIRKIGLPIGINTEFVGALVRDQQDKVSPETQICMLLKSVKMIVTASELDTSEVEEKTYSISSATENSSKSIKIDANEFITEETTLYGSEQKSFDEISYYISSVYQKGRETADIVCSVTNFIQDDGNDVFVKKFFDIGDEVIPKMYSKTAKGNELSVDAQGKEKKFVVANRKIVFDGGLRQELTLVESKFKPEYKKGDIVFSVSENRANDITKLSLTYGKKYFINDVLFTAGGLGVPEDTLFFSVSGKMSKIVYNDNSTSWSVDFDGQAREDLSIYIYEAI